MPLSGDRCEPSCACPRTGVNACARLRTGVTVPFLRRAPSYPGCGSTGDKWGPLGVPRRALCTGHGVVGVSRPWYGCLQEAPRLLRQALLAPQTPPGGLRVTGLCATSRCVYFKACDCLGRGSCGCVLFCCSAQLLWPLRSFSGKNAAGPPPPSVCAGLAEPSVTSAEKPTVARLQFLPRCRQYGHLSLGLGRGIEHCVLGTSCKQQVVSSAAHLSYSRGGEV